jgi:Holliday junction resolvase RusA-like endonuclease
MTIAFDIPGEPYGLKRHRTRVTTPKGRKPFAQQYDPKENVDRKAQAQFFMREAAGVTEPPVFRVPYPDQALELRITATFSLPRSQHRKRTPRPRSWHTKKPDIDNILKWILDAGTGVLWTDDKQIASVSVAAWVGAQGEAPRTQIVVYPLIDNA